MNQYASLGMTLLSLLARICHVTGITSKLQPKAHSMMKAQSISEAHIGNSGAGLMLDENGLDSGLLIIGMEKEDIGEPA